MSEGATASEEKRRRGIWVAGGVGVLVLALLSAFLGYGWWTRRGDVEYSRGGSDFLDAERLAASPPSLAPSVPPGVEPVRTPSSAPGPAGPLPRASASAAPTATSVPAPARSAKPMPVATVQPKGVQRPASGVYQLAVSGKEGVKFGPLSFCDRTLPTSTSLVVAPAQGEPDGSYTFDLRYYPGEPAQHDERQILRYTRNAVTMTFEVGTVTCSGVRQSSEISYDPAVDRVRLPLKVGAEWSGKSGNAKRTETYTTRILRRDTVELGGRGYPVHVIESQVTFTGDESGERRRVWWFSPAHGMPLKWTEYIRGGRSGAAYTNDVTVEVRSLPDGPATPDAKQAAAPMIATDARQRSPLN